MADYASGLMTCLGERPGEVISASELAQCLQLEVPTVSKLLKLLARAGLVDSFRGAAGGYVLARPAAEITVAAVVEAIDGPIALTECSLAAGLCPRESLCTTRRHWQRINAHVLAALQAVSVADMMQEPSARAPAHPLAAAAAGRT